MRITSKVALCAAAIGSIAAAMPTVGQMQWHRRVLLIAAASPQDPQAVVQRRILSDWESEAKDRDVSLVAVFGKQVDGAGDSAAALSRRYHLKPDAFQALLIGKDGHVALRSDRPIDQSTLQGTIDAMPMRQAGQR